MQSQLLSADLEGSIRLMDGSSGAGYEYGRLEIFVRGFWSTVCNNKGFTPDSALVACRSLGFDGGVDLFLGTVCLRCCQECVQGSVYTSSNVKLESVRLPDRYRISTSCHDYPHCT